MAEMALVQSFLGWRDTQRSSSHLLDSLSCRNKGTKFLCNSTLLPLLQYHNLCLGKAETFPPSSCGRVRQHKNCPKASYQNRLALAHPWSHGGAQSPGLRLPLALPSLSCFLAAGSSPDTPMENSCTIPSLAELKIAYFKEACVWIITMV